MCCTIIDEGASLIMLSSTAWQALCSPLFLFVTENLFDFNRVSEPLGILPRLPITLERKILCIDVMVVQGPLDFNLLLGRDYVYAMKVIISTLLCVISLPHDGRIVTIDQLSFIDPDWITSLNGSYV